MAKPQIKMGASITDYHQVSVPASAMLSPYASIIGDVKLGESCAVFAGVHIRGDCEPIVIGDLTNIQENSCLHVSVGSKLVVGNRVTVGHNVVLHGCAIDDNVLVGMGSVVMDDAHIGSNCVIGAGSLVTQGKVFEPQTLIMGSPARAVRALTDEEVEAMVTVAADAYVEVAQSMTANGVLVHPEEHIRIWMPSVSAD